MLSGQGVSASPVRGRRRRRAPQVFEVARAHGLPEHPHLAPAVVEVVLPCDAVAHGLEHARDRIAEHGLATVAQRERTRRIGRDELDLDVLARTELRAPVAAPEREHAAQQVPPAFVAQPDVDEAGTRHLGARDHALADAEQRDQPLGDLTRRAAQRLREQQRDIAREIAVLGAARNLEAELGQRRLLGGFGEQLRDRGAEAFVETRPHAARESPASWIWSRKSGT